MKAPADVLEIFLQPGGFYFGDERTRIRTLLGSCVAITMWHPARHVGGMCHYLLPSRQDPARKSGLDGRYADDAMQMFLAEMRATRTHPCDYQVKLFGGARMFRELGTKKGWQGISERNVDHGKAMMGLHGIHVAAQDLGGAAHRILMLDLWSGDVWLKRARTSGIPAAGPATGRK